MLGDGREPRLIPIFCVVLGEPMKHLSPTPTLEKTRGPVRRSFASKLAVLGTAAALIAAPVLISATAANAADPFAVTTPADGATGVAQSVPNVADFAGTGLPVADYANVTYQDALGVPHNATFAGSTNDGNGNWTGGENFGQLSQGQTHVVAVVNAIDDQSGNVDATITPVTVTFDFAVAPNPANPFVVVTPADNSTTPVESTTPLFSGTGNPGATIVITYPARAGGIETAANVVVAADGTFSTTTDFGRMEPGSTDGRATLTEYGTDGEQFPGSAIQSINFIFPSAPAPAIPLTVTTAPKSSTVSAVSTVGEAFLATGFSPDEEVTVVITDANGAEVTLPATTDHFYVDAEEGSLIGLAILPKTVTADTYTITVTGVRTARTASGTFDVIADPASTGGSGTGTTGTGSLPVVSG